MIKLLDKNFLHYHKKWKGTERCSRRELPNLLKTYKYTAKFKTIMQLCNGNTIKSNNCRNYTSIPQIINENYVNINVI